MLEKAFYTTFALLATALVVVYLYFRNQYSYWKRKHVDFIKPLPLVGNFLSVLTVKESFGEWSFNLYNQNKDKDYFGAYVFDRPYLFVQSPELVKHILLNNSPYFQTRERTIAGNDEVMENVLFLSTNPQGWKHMRAKVTPVFTSGKLKMMYPFLLENSNILVDYLKQHVSAECIEAQEVVTKFTINCIARCAFGVEANCFKSEDAEFRILAKEMFEYRPSLAFRQASTLFIPSLVKLFGIQFWPDRTMNKLKATFQTVLKEKSKMNELKGNDLIDMLLELKKSDKEFNDNVILGNAIQFFGAGFETTSATLAHSMYELAMNPDIQERLRTEINETLEKHNFDCSMEAINNMKYLELVVCEVLRKYPSVPFLDRRCNQDFKVPNSDFVIEKNIPIFISLLGLHYDERYFPNPQKFDPERFSNKQDINQNGIYYAPFGAGIRNCLGDRFGRIVVKLGLVKILSNFKIEKSTSTPDSIALEPTSFLLHSTVGVPVKITAL